MGCGWFGRKGAGGQSSGVMGSLDGELGWICGFVDDVDLLACHFLVTVKMNKRPLLSVALPHQQSPCCRTAEPHSGGVGRRGPSLWQRHLEPTSESTLETQQVCVSKAVCLTVGRGPLTILSELGFCPCSHPCCFPLERLGFPLKAGSVLWPQTKLYKDNIFKKGFAWLAAASVPGAWEPFLSREAAGQNVAQSRAPRPALEAVVLELSAPGGFSTSRLQSVHLDNRLGRVVRAPKSGCPNSTEDMGYVCKHSKGNHGKDILNDSRTSSQNQWGKDGGVGFWGKIENTPALSKDTNEGRTARGSRGFPSLWGLRPRCPHCLGQGRRRLAAWALQQAAWVLRSGTSCGLTLGNELALCLCFLIWEWG